METQTENQRPNNGQLIYVPHKDTIRLLEVYVKRSLSLNDGTLRDKKLGRKEKWVTMPRKQRRHSSDPSLHLTEGFNDGEIGTFSGVEPPANQPEKLNELEEESEKPTRKSKKSKKPSFWKNLFGIFYRKSNEDKDEDEDSPSEIPEVSQGEELADSATTCLPTTPVTLQKRKSMRRKSIKRRFSKRRLSSTKHNKSIKELNAADITRVEAFVSVEPTYSYYEKVSQELERIVHEVQEKEEVKPLSDEEVINQIIALTKEQGDAIDDKLKDNPTLNNFSQLKLADAYLENEATPTHNPPTVLPTAPEPLSDEEVINRIIALTREQGDAIDEKLKDNPILNNFFQRMPYSSFMQLADAYLENEATPTHNPPTVLPTAPELVKLALTCDFTAKMARLSKQNLGHITGLGYRYLQDRFEYQQACTDHPGSDTDS